MRICAFLALVLALIGSALAAEPSADESANAIMPGCRSLLRKVQTQPHFQPHFGKNTKKEEEACITGLDVAFILSLGPAPPYGSPFCIPNDVTMGQKVAVVVKHIDEHPEEMHLYFTVLAYEALLRAWPCKP
jgi:hypothetical protein